MAATEAAIQPPALKHSPISSRNCKKCNHLPICTVYRAIKQLLEKWTQQTRPFEAEDLATICKAFLADSLIKTLEANGK